MLKENGNPMPQSLATSTATGRYESGARPTTAHYNPPKPTRATVTALAHHVTEVGRIQAQLAGMAEPPYIRPSYHIWETSTLELIARLTGKQVQRRRIGEYNDWVVIVDGVEFWSSFSDRRR